MNDPCKLSNFKSVVYSPLEVNLTLNWNSPIPAANISVLELNMGESQEAGSLKPPVFLVLSVWAQFFLLLCHSRENHPSIARFTSAVCISLVADYLRQCIAMYRCMAVLIPKWYYLQTWQTVIQNVCKSTQCSDLWPKDIKDSARKGTSRIWWKSGTQNCSLVS